MKWAQEVARTNILPDVEPEINPFDIDPIIGGGGGGMGGSSTTTTTVTSSSSSGTMSANISYGVDISAYIQSEQRKARELIQTKIISNKKY